MASLFLYGEGPRSPSAPPAPSLALVCHRTAAGAALVLRAPRSPAPSAGDRGLLPLVADDGGDARHGRARGGEVDLLGGALVRHDHEHGVLVAGGRDLLAVERHERVAAVHDGALAHVRRKAVAVHLDGVEPDVDEQLEAGGERQPDRVARLLHHDGDGSVARGHNLAGGRLDGDALAHGAGREDGVVHLGQRDDGAGDRRAERAVLRELAHGLGAGDGGHGGADGRLGRAGCRGGDVGAVERDVLDADAAVDALGLADDVGEHERDDDCHEHAQRERQEVLGVDGEDAGQAADTDSVGRGGGGGADDAGDGGADHGAHEREDVLQVDAEHGGLGDAQVAREAGGDVDLLRLVVVALQHDHGEDGGALRDVGQRDHGPEHGGAGVRDELQVDGVGHVVQAGDDERRVQAAEDSAKQHAERPGDAGHHDVADRGAERPADGADDEVRGHDAQEQRAERDDDHLHDGRGDLLEEALIVVEADGREDGRDDLRLVADHVDLCKAEVPRVGGPVLRGGAGDGVRVHELARDEREAEHDAEHGGAAHLLGDGVADAHGDAQVEDGLADEPQEVVYAGPEHGERRERLRAVGPEVGHVAQDVAEAQDEAAGDDGGDERGEDLGDGAHGLLQRVLVADGGLLHVRLGRLAHAGDGDEVVVEVRDVVTDDDLELACLREAALGRLERLDCRYVRLARVRQCKAHTSHAVCDRHDVVTPADKPQKLCRVFPVLSHVPSTCLGLAPFSSKTYLNRFLL